MRMFTGNIYQLAAFLLSRPEGNSSQGVREGCSVYFSVCNVFASCVLLMKENSKPKMNPKAVGMNAIGEKTAPACFCDQGQNGEIEGK